MRNRVQSNIRMKAEKHKLQISKHVLNAAIVAGSSVASLKPVKVNGFVFPLTSMDDIERLEEVVRADFAIREQYVEYLASRKPPSVDVSNFFSYLFTDDALINYNFSGANNVGDQKMPMRNYSIFTDCMIEAWGQQGLTMDTLEEKIKLIIKKLTARRRMQKFRQRRSLK
uniref:(northern house mosquito) hypothetical protein n=1 Tax=Culex pipiens TaxID=7175 RepID=A0A8D8BCA1_CULPI